MARIANFRSRIRYDRIHPQPERTTMSYKFQPYMMYRMPTHFGPSLGPRQGEEGRKFACKDTPKTTTLSVSFLTNREQLEDLLPEGFEVGEEPVVTVKASYMKEIEWLAGRGYNILGVSFPAVFEGKQDRAAGDFLAVLWENMCDPIVTGREELVYAKIWAEIPEPIVYGGKAHCTASWQGFKFLDIRAENLKQRPVETPAPSTGETSDAGTLRGILHYKYIPKTGEWGSEDVSYPVLTPAEVPNQVITEHWEGEGTVAFHRATWEDMPTQFQIVNALEELEIKAYRGAKWIKSVGSKDLSDQRILR